MLTPVCGVRFLLWASGHEVRACRLWEHFCIPGLTYTGRLGGDTVLSCVRSGVIGKRSLHLCTFSQIRFLIRGTAGHHIGVGQLFRFNS